ncbi:DNA topology modulation protein [Klebsiella pneumoniae subsp. ozaenae]|uniref:DNA topology modulation protein n=1 Tax=Klebsiella pneumoniae subsp. ozaenae TaxID=574 RepID=A0A378B3G1_KLEPO|nr:DNA topology modulation protein [Klebsiella pneumoniae subsp. ozaenae]
MVSGARCARRYGGRRAGRGDIRSCGPGTGNCESFRRSFCSRESIILWTLKTWRQHRRRYLADMQDPQYRHIRFVRVRNPRQAEALLRELEAQRSAGHI